MLYLPSDPTRLFPDVFALKIFMELHQLMIGLTVKSCSNCGVKTPVIDLTRRHGLNGGYDTCHLCDIELENDH